MEIIKRDGRIEPYQSEKIKAAVAAAFQSIKTEIDEAVLNSITEDVQQQLVQLQQQHESLQVETIQDVVEKTLVARNFYNEVKSLFYIVTVKLKKELPDKALLACLKTDKLVMY